MLLISSELIAKVISGRFVFRRAENWFQHIFPLITAVKSATWFGVFVSISLYGTKLQLHQTIIMVNNVHPRMRGGEILPCHAKMAFLFIILCFSHDLFFSVLIQLQSCFPFVQCQIDFGGSSGRQSFDCFQRMGQNKFSAHFPFPDGEIIFTFEHTNYAGETLTLNTFFPPPTTSSHGKFSRATSNWQMPSSSIPWTAFSMLLR